MVALPALAGPQIPGAAIDERVKLAGEKKVRYLLRQSDLTEEQAAQAQALIDSVLPKQARPTPPNPDEVRRIWTELEQAREAGDQSKVDALTRELRQIGHETPGDAEFFASLEPLLTDEQKVKLEEARARLERNPSGALRPVDLLQAARRLDLDEPQQGKLLEAVLAARRQLGPVLRPSEELKLRMINSLADDIQALLTPDQLDKLEHRLRALRPDLIDQGLRVRMPQLSPDEPPTGDEDQPAED
jgi:hypothetical protein